MKMRGMVDYEFLVKLKNTSQPQQNSATPLSPTPQHKNWNRINLKIGKILVELNPVILTVLLLLLNSGLNIFSFCFIVVSFTCTVIPLMSWLHTINPISHLFMTSRLRLSYSQSLAISYSLKSCNILQSTIRPFSPSNPSRLAKMNKILEIIFLSVTDTLKYLTLKYNLYFSVEQVSLNQRCPIGFPR